MTHKVMDRQLYQQAYAALREWNEAELVDRAQDTSKLSPADAWRQYASLVKLCYRLAANGNDWQRRLKLVELNLHYERLQKLEHWRTTHG
jgi:hypothetical protein